jgi:hypothetical protein
MNPIDELERQYANDWRIVYPRIYEDTGTFHSPRELAADLLSVFLTAARSRELHKTLGYLDAQALMGASLITSLRVPTFFLARNLLEALAQTRPPEAISWTEMHLPFESAAFIFPRGALRRANSDELSCLWYARMRKEQIYRNPFSRDTYEVIEDVLCFRGFLNNSLESLMHSYGASTHPEIHAIDLSADGNVFRGESTAPLNREDQEVLESGISLVLNTLLVMLERPQMVANGAFRGKRSRKGAEFWTPNIVGKEYRATSAHLASSEPGTHPRLHWRRGHWRNQPYGPARHERKYLWIEPTLVGAGMAASEERKA